MKLRGVVVKSMGLEKKKKKYGFGHQSTVGLNATGTSYWAVLGILLNLSQFQLPYL